MSEPIWCDVSIRFPDSWNSEQCQVVVGAATRPSNPLVAGLTEALINGYVEAGDEDEDVVNVHGEGNYGLYDADVAIWLDWMREHKVPFVASSDAKYEFEGETVVFDGTNEYSGTSGVDQALLSKQEYDSIKAGRSEFATVEAFFTVLNTSVSAFSIEHLPAGFPGDDEWTLP